MAAEEEEEEEAVPTELEAAGSATKRRFYGRPISGYLMVAAALDVRLKAVIGRSFAPQDDGLLPFI